MNSESAGHSAQRVLCSFERTEVKTMKYESPQVVCVGAAMAIIEGQQLKRGVVVESFPDLFLTAPAYEADE
jgi:hypothetical protein